MERFYWLLAVTLILGGSAFGFFRFLDRRLAKGAKEARGHAIKTGLIIVEKVLREVPYFASNFEKPELRRELVTAYCLPHAVRKASRWERGKISMELEKVMGLIAEEWDSEYLEFEFYPDKVYAYWYEWGGAEIVNRVRSYLERISSAS